jgi:hypothetical protein
MEDFLTIGKLKALIQNVPDDFIVMKDVDGFYVPVEDNESARAIGIFGHEETDLLNEYCHFDDETELLDAEYAYWIFLKGFVI